MRKVKGKLKIDFRQFRRIPPCDPHFMSKYSYIPALIMSAYLSLLLFHWKLFFLHRQGRS